MTHCEALLPAGCYVVLCFGDDFLAAHYLVLGTKFFLAGHYLSRVFFAV